MHNHFGDILRRISEAPLWWDNGYPRYDPFRPNDTANVYASEAVLVFAYCQCGVSYKICITHGGPDRILGNEIKKSKDLSVGDPPQACGFRQNVEYESCGSAADSCIPVSILEYWHRTGKELNGSSLTLRGYPDWVRDASLEIELKNAGHSQPSYPVPNR